MITKDGRDLPIEQLTAENYVVPKGEERYYHAVIEVKQFDSKTGKRLSHPRVQKFGRKMFESHVAASLRKQGYEILILHNPTEWLKQNKAAQAEQAKAKAEAEKKKFEAAVAAEVARQLAAMKARKPEAEGNEAEKKPGRPAKTEK